MEEISSGLSLPTKQHSSRASPPGGSQGAPGYCRPSYVLQNLLAPVVHEHFQEVGRRGLHAFCQAVDSPALLALGHLPAVEKQPQLLALVQGCDELPEVR